MSLQHHVTPVDDASGRFPDRIVRAMGERPDLFRDELPSDIRNAYTDMGMSP